MLWRNDIGEFSVGRSSWVDRFYVLVAQGTMIVLAQLYVALTLGEVVEALLDYLGCNRLLATKAGLVVRAVMTLIFLLVDCVVIWNRPRQRRNIVRQI